MTDLAALIEELGKAGEGSRALDNQIARYCRSTTPADPAEWPWLYTTSLDAALKLVPEGRAMKWAFLPAAHWPWRVWVFPDKIMPLEVDAGKPALGYTPAVALCIAALRARDTVEG